MKFNQIKCTSINEAAAEALNHSLTGTAYVALHTSTEVHSIRDIRAGIGAETLEYDHCILFDSRESMEQFLAGTKSTISTMTYVKTVYTVSEYLGATISIEHDDDEISAELDPDIISTTKLEIEVYDRDTFETLGTFDNGMDAEALAGKLEAEDEDRRISIGF